jgi:P-type Mg2+ transporter
MPERASPIEAREAAGLTSEAAAKRLAEWGANDPAPRARRSSVREFLRLFLNPLVVVLLIAAIASAVLGEATDAGIICAIVVLSNTLDFVQTHRSQNAVERLRAQVAPRASVLRDGQWREIRSTEVVPGDVVHLSAGDLVPADAQLLESRDLYVQQGALTGESLPVEKQAGADTVSRSPDSQNMVFLGTSVVSGTARVLVTATGRATQASRSLSVAALCRRAGRGAHP